MTNMIIAFVSLLMAFLIYSVSFNLNGLNRAVINTPIELIESSIPALEEELYFDKVILETKLLDYYQSSLTKYCKSYEVSFYYYNKIDESMCISDSCDAIEVTINAKVVLSVDYHRVMFYEIRG